MTIQSCLMEDYNRTGVLPTIDELLDWRLKLVTRRDQNKHHVVIAWYEDEIQAVDLLLDKHSNK